MLLFNRLKYVTMIQHTVINNKKNIHSDWLSDDIINLMDPTFIIPSKYDYEILEVTEKYLARPDILSKDIYGDVMYSDLICKLNGISNPFELNVGTILVIPSPDCITEFMKIPTVDECDDTNKSVNKPVAKRKNEKRKANESVIGDTRFRIDKTKGIVIY